jgi:hypothetical protein
MVMAKMDKNNVVRGPVCPGGTCFRHLDAAKRQAEKLATKKATEYVVVQWANEYYVVSGNEWPIEHNKMVVYSFKHTEV